MIVPAEVKKLNSDFNWDDFDPVEYVKHNYATLRDDDRKILVEMREFFASVGGSYREPWRMRGIDVGSGPNLYPALAMLPFCGEVTLSDIAASNIDWLRDEVPSYSPTWDPFWKVLTERAAYKSITDPRGELRRKVELKKGDLFSDLPRARYDIGTMFFVAESLSEEWFEFHRATHRFLRALKPGAPFAAAFMESSEGYPVGGRPFPAVPIGIDHVEECLDGVAHNVRIRRWPANPDDLLRHGYTGMILALGKAGVGKG